MAKREKKPVHRVVLAPGIFDHKNAGDFNQILPELFGQFLPK